MRTLVFTLALTLTAASSCLASDGEDGSDTPSTANAASAALCTAGDSRLPVTGLCQHAAAAMLPSGPAETPIEGCVWTIRETPFATDMLLYRTLHCESHDTVVEFQFGNRQSQLIYTNRADGGPTTDADGEPVTLARIFAGNPDGRARALWEARDSMRNRAKAKRCTLRAPYQPDGLLADAMIVDIPRGKAGLERDDAMPECGPFGYNPAGGSIEFWRTHQGYAWFFHMGTDLWDIDPGSFTILEKGEEGTWRPLPAQPAGAVS